MLNINSLQSIGVLLDLIGSIVILAGVILSSLAIVKHMYHHISGTKVYNTYRKDLARSILLGLEFLVAGDIIRTITEQAKLTSVISLAIIVLIRSLLGAEFEMEITGHWPWQSSKKKRPKKIANIKRNKKK